MANWYYYDNRGKKLGPINDVQLKALVTNGTVTRDTLIETEQGKQAKAEKVKGLIFAEPVAVAVPVTPVAETDPVTPPKEEKSKSGIKIVCIGTIIICLILGIISFIVALGNFDTFCFWMIIGVLCYAITIIITICGKIVPSINSNINNEKIGCGTALICLMLAIISFILVPVIVGPNTLQTGPFMMMVAQVFIVIALLCFVTSFLIVILNPVVFYALYRKTIFAVYNDIRKTFSDIRNTFPDYCPSCKKTNAMKGAGRNETNRRREWRTRNVTERTGTNTDAVGNITGYNYTHRQERYLVEVINYCKVYKCQFCGYRETENDVKEYVVEE
jgi:hypothetical protein